MSYPPRLVQPFEEIQKGGLTELVAAGEQVDQNDYGASVGVALAERASGVILSFAFYTRTTGIGAVLTPAGSLYVLAADPALAAGDTSMSAAGRQTVVGQVPVAAGDWKSDTNGASVCITNTPIPFHALDTLYFAWFHEDAAAFNDAGGDDEILEFDFWYRRDS
jgi:hypothetical protein